jgi:hypothetical protein
MLDPSFLTEQTTSIRKIPRHVLHILYIVYSNFDNIDVTMDVTMASNPNPIDIADRALED